MTDKPLRIVTFNTIAAGYNLVTRWIAETNNKHVLAITSPGPTTRPNVDYKNIVADAPRNIDVLVTTRLRTVAAPLIRALEPDLILCAGFSYLLPEEIVSIPTIGAVNFHPTVLPAYRGPNPFRMFYEGWHEYGTTVHWMANEFDTGNILAQSRSPMPDKIDPQALMMDWIMTGGYQAIREGMEKAIAGDKGIKQDDSQASYGAPFIEEEKWLNWDETRNMLKRKHFSLNFVSQAKAHINDKAYQIMSLEVLSDYDVKGVTGDVLSQDEDGWIIQVGDGAVKVTVKPLDE